MAAGSPEKGGKPLTKKQKKKDAEALHEPLCIRVAQKLEQFMESDDQVYKLEDQLGNRQRAAVHMLCKKMGLKSKSHGRGQNRRLSVYKTNKCIDMREGRENLVSFRFSGESEAVLEELFSMFPPDDVDMAENKFRISSGKAHNARGRRDDLFCRSAMTQTEILGKVKIQASKFKNQSNLRQIAEAKSKLPIASFRDAITSTVESNQVVLICGETGCGKTTQVPQFLLEHAWSKGETCKIVCTQPRRISATSVAERIATERGEDIGDSVGYKIRMESKGGRHSSLVFCTNGILLRILVSKGSSGKASKNALSEITHIIVDEIHERDRFADFILAIIRDILPSFPHLRLILMSATLDAERFSKYFSDCPIIRVPGFTYPVKTFFLEDVVSIVRSSDNNNLTFSKDSETIKDSPLSEECRVVFDEAIDSALSNDEFDPLLELISSQGDSRINNYQHSKTGVTPLMVFAGKGRVCDVCMLLSFGVDCHLQSHEGKTAFDYAEQDNQGEVSEIIKKHMDKAFTSSEEEQKLLDKYLASVDREQIDYVLIEKLLRRICSDSEDGAVLVFLPGWDDINRTRDKLLASPFFNNPSKFLIISLHSMVPLVDQKKVFKRPPSGCRKIVLSTNIAETSVTIDDVVYVVDSGRMKEKSYDPYNNVSTLRSSWISKASAKQREGRAGRCQPGVCYHLYTKLRASSLLDFQVPEIKRMPIEELCLQVKLLDPSCKIEEFLQKTLDPPVFEAIRNAITVLREIGALSVDDKLTEFGEKIGSLPVHPLTSKMLFLAILLNCLDPALTLACATDFRDPFILPMQPTEKKKAQAAKLELASLYGGNGDQLAVIAAFDCWKMAKKKGEQARFCSQYFINSNTMRMLSSMRKQLEGELSRNGFLPEDKSHCSRNAHNPGIIHAIIFSGLYPRVGRVIPHGKRSLVETADKNKVRLHPFSMNAKLSAKKSKPQPLIIFDEITRGDGGLHIRNCSVMGSLPFLLLAKEIVVAPASENADKDDESDCEDGGDDDDSDEDKKEGSNSQQDKIMSSPENLVKVVVDHWLPFKSTALNVAQIYCLRERLSAAIQFKVTHSNKVLPPDLGFSLYAIACILSYDGMSGIILPPDQDTVATDTHGKKMPTDQASKNYLRSLLHLTQDHNNPASHNQSWAQDHHMQPSYTVGVDQHVSGASQSLALDHHIQPSDIVGTDPHEPVSATPAEHGSGGNGTSAPRRSGGNGTPNYRRTGVPGTPSARRMARKAALSAHGSAVSATPASNGGAVSATPTAHDSAVSGTSSAHGGAVSATTTSNGGAVSATSAAHDSDASATPSAHGGTASATPAAHEGAASATPAAHEGAASATPAPRSGVGGTPNYRRTGVPGTPSARRIAAAAARAAAAVSATPPANGTTGQGAAPGKENVSKRRRRRR